MTNIQKIIVIGERKKKKKKKHKRDWPKNEISE